MRAKFRKALVDILNANNTAIYDVMWATYRDNLRDIDPAELPANLRIKFEWLKKTLDDRCESQVRSACMTYNYQERRYVMTKDPAVVRAQVESGKDWYYTPLKGFNAGLAKKVKMTIFEITESLPKRTPKKKVQDA